MKQKIIFFDIEGGHGGSSRSLFYTLSNLPLDKFQITVVCKKNSWLKIKYLKKGIHCKIFNEIPCFSSLKGWINNILLFFKFITIVWPKFYVNKQKYIKLIKQNDVVHLNQISLVFFGLWIKKKFPNKIITMHIRTMPYDNFFSWLKIYVSKQICEKFIFITKHEKKHMQNILEIEKIKGDIILNPLPDWKLNSKTIKNKINIASLSNYDFERGTDRVLEVASMIPQNIRKNYTFHMIGDYKIRKKIRNFFSKKDNLINHAKYLGVKNMFKFYGHVDFPEIILNKCQYLIKLTRENNAWGRDVIESMYLGLGILATGNKNNFIKNNYNGYLFKKYSPKKISILISRLNKNIIKKHQYSSKILINKLCNKKNLNNQFEKFWLSIPKNHENNC